MVSWSKNYFFLSMSILLGISLLVLSSFFPNKPTVPRDQPSPTVSSLGKMFDTHLHTQSFTSSRIPEGVSSNPEKSLFSIHVDNMPRQQILQLLLEEFKMEVSAQGIPEYFWEEPLSMQITDKSLLTALTQLFGNTSFNLASSFDEHYQKHLTKLIIGEGFARSHNQHMQEANTDITATAEIDRPSDDAMHDALPPFSENDSVIRREQRDIFYVSDQQTRKELVDEMSPVGQDLVYLMETLLHDEDRDVRIAAAKRLSFSESYGATHSLLQALSDQDDQVVSAAIQSLSAIGDSSVLATMEQRLDHRSEKVQQSLSQARAAMTAQFTLATDEPDKR